MYFAYSRRRRQKPRQHSGQHCNKRMQPTPGTRPCRSRRPVKRSRRPASRHHLQPPHPHGGALSAMRPAVMTNFQASWAHPPPWPYPRPPCTPPLRSPGPSPPTCPTACPLQALPHSPLQRARAPPPATRNPLRNPLFLLQPVRACHTRTPSPLLSLPLGTLAEGHRQLPQQLPP